MPRKLTPRPCACGCGDTTRGSGAFLPGHDQKLRTAIERHVGGVLALRRLVEDVTNRTVAVGHESRLIP